MTAEPFGDACGRLPPPPLRRSRPASPAPRSRLPIPCVQNVHRERLESRLSPPRHGPEQTGNRATEESNQPNDDPDSDRLAAEEEALRRHEQAHLSDDPASSIGAASVGSGRLDRRTERRLDLAILSPSPVRSSINQWPR